MTLEGQPAHHTAAVVTVSDACSRGQREDLSGPAVTRELEGSGFHVVQHLTLPDEQSDLQDALRTLSREIRLIVTTGGTGIGPRDVTPEATREVCDRLLDGIAELMRSEGRHETPLAVLSRGLCGTLGTALILNVPGSPRAASSSVRAVLPVLPHALELLAGKTEHAPSAGSAHADAHPHQEKG